MSDRKNRRHNRGHLAGANAKKAVGQPATSRTTVRLGGLDREVAAFFFSLDNAHLSALFEAYGVLHGLEQRLQVETAFPKWRSGESEMNAMVANQLYEFLPPLMPMAFKLRIAEGLFHRSGKRRTDYVLAPLNSSAREIIIFIDLCFFSDLNEEGIDDLIYKQLEWLSGYEKDIEQKLLSHVLKLTYETKKKAVATMIEQLEFAHAEQAEANKIAPAKVQLRKHAVKVLRTETVDTIQAVDEEKFAEAARPSAVKNGTFGLVLGASAAVLVAFAWLISR